uniref:Uncharacterized protein LOC111133669 isoform X2 n=1 Tax=Crassostrea virginica TaxID=6565 RepID=A0A8B8EE69_CRAVI|nr:uncharacterized protein LOC111133669 isoform X2 [Crassostrea virginica]
MFQIGLRTFASGCLQEEGKHIANLIEGPAKCVITQEKQSISIPHSVPSFLSNRNRSQCQAQNAGNKMLRCGWTDVYLKPECVCSFYNVYEASLYHGYSSCPEGSGSDIVTQLKCSDCKRYSLNNNGPCINGGKLTCRGDEVAPSSTCVCPPNYEGMFCEEKIEKVTRICYRISRFSAHGLINCSLTGRECVTYSKNMLYAYKCNEFQTSKRRRSEELPLCFNTEDVLPDKMPAGIELDVSDVESSCSLKTGGISSTSYVRWTVLIMFGTYFVSV